MKTKPRDKTNKQTNKQTCDIHSNENVFKTLLNGSNENKATIVSTYKGCIKANQRIIQEAI